METIRITRKQHDWLMDNNSAAFGLLFQGPKKNRKWSLGGLNVYNLPAGTTTIITAALEKMPK